MADVKIPQPTTQRKSWGIFLFGMCILSILALVVVASPPFNFSTLWSSEPKFAYYLSVMKCHSSSAANYTIHGLWINYANGGYPEFCHRTKWDVKLLDPIRNRMDQDWPDCFGSHHAETFWEHEWKKHGTCFDPALTVVGYFEKALDLFDKKVKMNGGPLECRSGLVETTTNMMGGDCLVPVQFDEIYS